MEDRKDRTVGGDVPETVDPGAGPAPHDRIVGDNRVPAGGTLGTDDPGPAEDDEELFDRDELMG